MNNQSITKYWKMPAAEVLADLDSSRKGLSFSEAKSRLLKYGKNEIQAQTKRPAWKILLSQFKSPLVLILLAASIISGILGETVSTGIIVLIILCSAVLAFFQEYKSESAMDKLRKKVSLKTTVIRDNKPQMINAANLVLGDIVLLDLGKAVPADLRLIETDDLLINESLLTGESFPVEKNAKPLGVNNYLPQAMANLAFMGTHVAQGSGKGIVIATAKNTELGKTAHLLQAKPQETEFQKGIGKFGILLAKVILFFTLGIFLILAVFKHNIAESLLFSLAIAVGISPELLPMIITINLSNGAQKMAKKKVIVKRLMSIEDLGNVDILCADKTGTLTEGKISLVGFYNLAGKNNREVLADAWLCNSLTVAKDFFGNPLDEAIIVTGKKEKVAAEIKGCEVLDSLPFDFTRRKMSVIAECRGKRQLICKGAVEEMLAVCRKAKLNGRTESLAPNLKKLKEKFLRLEKDGLRLLLIANKEIGSKSKYGPDDETGLILTGYLAFSDKPKETAKKSLAAFKNLGVRIKILTGDSELTAVHVCRELNCRTSKILLGQEIEAMTEEQLKAKVEAANIFAKITPEHKLRIINAYKSLGHTVGFLGDGVNDAPALRAADVGVSVDSAVDVAKEAADVVLLEKGLSVLADGIIEGRKTFGNTLKYILATINSNFGNMFSVAGAAIFLPFIPMLPVQILLLNFLSDFPMLAISSDKVDEEYLKKPKHWDMKIISNFMVRFGLLSSLFDFISFGLLLLVFKANASLFQTGWFWESFLTEVVVVYIIRTKKWFWQSLPSKTLFYTGLITTAIVLMFIYTKLGVFFDFTPLPLPILFLLVGVTAVYFGIVEVAKKTFYKKFGV